MGIMFKVRGPAGEFETEQLATFAAEVQGEKFRFVVIKTEDGFSLTHRESTKRVCLITATSAIHNGYEKAGRMALEDVIDRAGAARVRSVLAGA